MQDIGSARVRRTFTMRGKIFYPNHRLSTDEVLAIPIANRRALVDAGYLEIYPRRSALAKPVDDEPSR
jgi:hypothetical protein